MKNRYKYTLIVSMLLALGVALSAFFAGWHQHSKGSGTIDWYHILGSSGSWFIVTAIACTITGFAMVTIFGIGRRIFGLGRVER